MPDIVASRVRHVVAGETDTLIANGDAIIVHGIFVFAANNETVLFEVASTTDIIMRVEGFNPKRSVAIPLAFVADKGIQVTTDASSNAAVLFSQVGT